MREEDEMQSDLEHALVATKRKIELANERHLEAVQEAVEDGESYAAIGRVLGVSRQAVQQYVERGRAK